MEDLSIIIDGLRDDMVNMMKRWLSIPSVKAAAQPGAPFGQEVRKALDTALEDAKTLGFDVRDFDGYAGDIRMGEIGADPLAVLAHLDVVPAGDGWKTDPFTPTQVGDRIFARGTSDDKGPAVAALFAMLAVKKAGIPLKREVRMILGCDEESGWEDMDYYRAHCDMPRSGFSPDASYPIINTEKGVLHIELRAPFSAEGLFVKEIHVGERFNVVPGEARALVAGNADFCTKVNRLATDMHLTVEAKPQADGMVLITSSGVTGHAAYPEAAKNALGQLLIMLRALGVAGGLHTLADNVGMEYDGSSLGIRCGDDVSGKLTCNLGILNYDEANGLYATLDIRYPILCDHKALAAALTAALGDGVQAKVVSQTDPHHVAPNSPLVMALLDAYHEVTDRPRECISTGGGTYAKCLDEGVAFGCTFPEDEDLAHQADEYLSIDNMMLNVRIFARAIERLAGKN